MNYPIRLLIRYYFHNDVSFIIIIIIIISSWIHPRIEHFPNASFPARPVWQNVRVTTSTIVRKTPHFSLLPPPPSSPGYILCILGGDRGGSGACRHLDGGVGGGLLPRLLGKLTSPVIVLRASVHSTVPRPCSLATRSPPPRQPPPSLPSLLSVDVDVKARNPKLRARLLRRNRREQRVAGNCD